MSDWSSDVCSSDRHTLVQMVDNDLGVTLLPEMAIDAGLLRGTSVVARPLGADRAFREIALVWRANSPRAKEFQMLAGELKAAMACNGGVEGNLVRVVGLEPTIRSQAHTSELKSLMRISY